MVAHLTNEQRQLARRLRAKALKLADIARSVGCGHSRVKVELRRQNRPARPDTWTPRSGQLTIGEREKILLGLTRSESMRSIAEQLGRSPSTVTREVKANGAGRTTGSGRSTSARERAPSARNGPNSTIRPCALLSLRGLKSYGRPMKLPGDRV